MTQPQNQKQPSKTVALTAISLILNIVVLALVGGGVITPDQGAQFNEQINQQLTALAAQTHQDIQAINDTLQTSWNDTIGDPTFYTTQQPYNYVISNVSGYFCLQNGYTGQLITFNPNQTYIENMALGNLTEGGTVFLKEVTHTSTLTIPDATTVIERVNGVQTLYYESLPGQVASNGGLSPGAPSYTIASYITPLGTTFYYAKAANGTVMPWTSINSSYTLNKCTQIPFSNILLEDGLYIQNGSYLCADGVTVTGSSWKTIIKIGDYSHRTADASLT